MSKIDVVALIPARSGSRGLKDKNILPINGHPLIAYSIVNEVMLLCVAKKV